ncbi:hypothetical protein BWQ96_02830 [Gracilariopsis chorda]|uniref:Uncharacterized protein n=1 Tax=Gracilariopsis chorda TaxID=448386 RepID=A0A2V3J1S7_9FLOR|nr:hypothetical protein BWQ96_02830 [Gracilariopsis chorda]|eukprot:PXF47350.1 hypothetical protein BWQ96_02830 [Gracilariopsis chorda]
MGGGLAGNQKGSLEPSKHASLSVRSRRRHFPVRKIVSHYSNAVFLFSLIGIIAFVWFILRALSQTLHNIPSTHSKWSFSTSKGNEMEAVPRPILVIAGGGARTGSTFIFNILRVLMRIRDPNTVASSNWMLAKLVPENNTLTNYDRIALLKSMGTSILIKVHTAKQYYDFAGPAHRNTFAKEVDLLVTGYRDLRDETVSAYKMFAKNRSEWESESKWAEQCQALIRRRNSLILEAGSNVPVVDIRYESWRDGGSACFLQLIRQLGSRIPWSYTEQDYKSTLNEVLRLRVPSGGDPSGRIDWHISNLMSPRHISTEQLSTEFVDMGIRAIIREPKCAAWLTEKGYL